MAFTLSHTLVAYCFPGRVFNRTAIAIGCMTPDLAYFIPFLGLDRSVTHEAKAIPYLLLFSVLLYYLFKFYLRTPWKSFLPLTLQSKIKPLELNSGIFPLLFYFSIGIGSHLLWDAFSHHQTFLTDHLPILEKVVEVNQYGTIRFYHLVQYYSSIVALIIICGLFFRSTQKTPPQFNYMIYRSKNSRIVFWLCVITTIIYSFIAVFYDFHLINKKAVWIQYLICAVTGWILSTFSYGVYLKYHRKT